MNPCSIDVVPNDAVFPIFKTSSQLVALASFYVKWDPNTWGEIDDEWGVKHIEFGHTKMWTDGELGKVMGPLQTSILPPFINHMLTMEGHCSRENAYAAYYQLALSRCLISLIL